MKPGMLNATFPGLWPYLEYIGHAGDDYGTVSRSAWLPSLNIAFSVMINHWFVDYPSVHSDAHAVYCIFWREFYGVLLEEQVPNVKAAFACPAVTP